MRKRTLGWLSSVSICLTLLLSPMAVSADSAGGLALLQSRQQADGSISDGYSNPSQWSAIAFAAHGIKAADVNNGGMSLYNYLLTDVGSGTATDIEARILAIHAVGGDASNFGGTNYLANLEAQYSGGQLGDPTLLNDDMFGLLALIAAGNSASTAIKQDVLEFIIAHQAPTGAFSYCSDYTAQWCDPSADLTGAALQALWVAKDNGIMADGHDTAIENAINYLHANQNSDGGFGYYGSSDADSTAWVFMALNLADSGSSVQINAKTWLENSQQPDGSFPAFSGNSTTTAHALIALSGNGWLVPSPISTVPGSSVVVGRGGVEPATVNALVERQEQMTELLPAASEATVPSQTTQAGEVSKNLADNLSTAGKIHSSIPASTSSILERWRWVFLAITGSSLLGASIYFVSYNGRKQ